MKRNGTKRNEKENRMSATLGKWIGREGNYPECYFVRCDCCGRKTMFVGRDPSNYCPECGSNMMEGFPGEPDSIPMVFIETFIKEHYGKWQATSLGAMLSAWKERSCQKRE